MSQTEHGERGAPGDGYPGVFIPPPSCDGETLIRLLTEHNRRHDEYLESLDSEGWARLQREHVPGLSLIRIQQVKGGNPRAGSSVTSVDLVGLVLPTMGPEPRVETPVSVFTGDLLAPQLSYEVQFRFLVSTLRAEGKAETVLWYETRQSELAKRGTPLETLVIPVEWAIPVRAGRFDSPL